MGRSSRGARHTAWLNRVVAVAAGARHGVALLADGAVTGWGQHGLPAGVTNPPPELSNVIAIAAGNDFSLALRADGTVVQWPTNEVPAGLRDVVAVAAGDHHSLALKSDGTVVAWGSNLYGQTDVPPGLSNVVAVSAGFSQGLALVGEGPPQRVAPVSCPDWSAGRFSLTVQAESGRVYRLEYRDSLAEGNWTPFPLVAGRAGALTLTDESAPLGHRFYRVRRW